MTDDRFRPAERPNPFAFLALMCGVASWVPLIVMITGPLTFAFALLAVMTPGRGRFRPALYGVGLALAAFALQAGIALIAGVFGHIG